MRPSALVLAPEAPYPMAGGGALRCASLIEYLAARYDLDAIVFREPGAPDPRAAFPSGRVRDVRIIDLPYHSRTPAARAARNLSRFLRGCPPLNDRFSGFEPAIAAALDGRRYDLALVEHFWCAPYAAGIAPHAGRVILDLHNIESVLYRSCADVEAWPASVLMRGFARAAQGLERRWLPRFSLLLAASKQDAVRVQALAPGAQVRVYPNALPEMPQPAVEEEHVIAFSGNLEYAPNVSAVRFFAARIWPALRARWPGLVWRLIGKNPDAVARYVARDPRIELRGPVADAVPELARAKVVIVPLLAGSGTRFKILEAWAAGRAVVSTAIGAEGLPADLCIADTPEDFARTVGRLLQDHAARRHLGAAGRSRYESEFTWGRAGEILATIGI